MNTIRDSGDLTRGGVYRDSLLETAQEAVPIAIMSAIDVTGKTCFERLYLVLGSRIIAP